MSFQTHYKKLTLSVAIMLIVYGLIQYLSMYYCLAVNISTSLPQHAFLIVKKSQLHRGDYAAFWPPANQVYGNQKPFIKQVVGMPGDIVFSEKRQFYVNHRYVGRALSISSKGLALESGKIGKLPPHQYFMSAPHPRSFDSRYAQMGWIDQHQIIGRAIPLF